ncbi:MAG: hypothetical protein ACRDBP_02465 [Luteolibacter sp.]
METRFLAHLLPLLLLASCATDSALKKKEPASTPERKTLSERVNEKNGYKQDAEGNWVAQNDKRSPYESKGSTYDSKKAFKKTDYKTGDFAKKSWWGNKDYDRKTYSGNTDASRFQKSSALQGETAPEAGDAAKLPGAYQTDSYATRTAREAGNKPIERTSNSIVESRERSFQQPEIIDWREQRSLSLDQSKGILGR